MPINSTKCKWKFIFISFVGYYIFKWNTIQGTILIIIHTFTELWVSPPPLSLSISILVAGWWRYIIVKFYERYIRDGRPIMTFTFILGYFPMSYSSSGTSSFHNYGIEGEVIGSRTTGCMCNLTIKKPWGPQTM